MQKTLWHWVSSNKLAFISGLCLALTLLLLVMVGVRCDNYQISVQTIYV